MPRRLPVQFRAWTVPDVTRPAAVRRRDQKSRDVIDTGVQILPPLKYPVGRPRDSMGKIRFDLRVKIYEVDRSRSGIREHSEEVSGRKKRTEAAHHLRARGVAAGNIGLQAEPRLERNRGDAVSGVRCECPGLDIRTRERAELLHALEIEIPGGPPQRDGAEEPDAHGVTRLVAHTPLVDRLIPVQ